MTNVIPNQPSTEIQKDQPQQIQPQDSNTIWQNGAGIQQGGNPQIMQPNMNGQNMPMGQMGFYGGPMQMMMPMQDPNYYGQNWNAGHMQNPAMINGHQQYGNFNNPNWSGPRWRRGGPPQGKLIFRNHIVYLYYLKAHALAAQVVKLKAYYKPICETMKCEVVILMQCLNFLIEE